MDFHRAGFDHWVSGNEQEIVSGDDTAQLSLDRCSHQTFHPVTLYGISQTAPCSDPNSQKLSFVFADDQHNKRVGKRLSRTPHPLEIGCFSQSKPASHLIYGARSCWVIIRSRWTSLSN